MGKKKRRDGVLIKRVEININNKEYEGDPVIVFDNSGMWNGKKFDMILNYEFVKEIGGIGL